VSEELRVGLDKFRLLVPASNKNIDRISDFFKYCRGVPGGFLSGDIIWAVGEGGGLKGKVKRVSEKAGNVTERKNEKK
jgi:hypothetical protein